MKGNGAGSINANHLTAEHSNCNSIQKQKGLMDRDTALANTSRLLHIGANKGEEASFYSSLGIEAWHVEAIPEVCEQLTANLAPLPNQWPLNRCLSSKEGEIVEFNVSSNDGLSSSLLDLGRHEYAYPFVSYTRKVQLTTSTVDGMLRDGDIPSDIDFLRIDAQGAELLILEGAKHFLSQGKLKYALIETAVDPLYANGSTYLEVAGFLREYGLHLRDTAFNDHGWADAFFQTAYWSQEPRQTIQLATQGINIGPEAVCTQSSSWDNRYSVERMAGIKTGRFSFHTMLEHQPWLKMAFDDLREINEIIVYNREDSCQHRARNINIYASTDGDTWDLIHENSTPFGGVFSDPLRVTCALQAKYLLFKLRDNTYLHLDQIEIYS